MVIPSVLPVVDDGSSQTPGWVDAGAGDGNGRQMNQKHSKPNGKRSQDLPTTFNKQKNNIIIKLV